MNCRKARSLLSAFSKGELSHSVKEKLLQHLENCPNCRKEKAVFEQIGQVIKHLPKYELSDDFNMKLFEKIHNAPRAERIEHARMPKAAPSAFAYRMKFVVPLFATVAVLVFSLTFITGTSQVDTGYSPELASIETPAVNTDRSEPVSHRSYLSGLRGLKLDQAMLESLKVAVSTHNGTIFDVLGNERKQEFGMLNSRSLVQSASGLGGNMRHYVLPVVSSTTKRSRNTAY